MIGRVEFAILGAQGGILRPFEDYGMYLVSYDAPPPLPKIEDVQIEGRSGSIDLTEWAGDVFYDTRNVTVKLRDMRGDATELVTRLNGRRVRVYFDDQPEWYFLGRVKSMAESTRRHVSDLTMQITCDPWKYPRVADGTGQYAASGNLPYSGYYNFSAAIASGASSTWTFELYQDTSTVELTVSDDFDIDDELLGNRSKIVVNGTETTIGQSGAITVPTPLLRGQNTIAVYNNQNSETAFTAAVKFANRVM